MIDTGEGGVAVMSVVPESVAAMTGLEAGDLVVEAAGVTVSDTGDLIAIVQRQAPGTWLPLVIRRNDGQLKLVAKFPPSF
jgi:S1-C subfamily serine protease